MTETASAQKILTSVFLITISSLKSKLFSRLKLIDIKFPYLLNKLLYYKDKFQAALLLKIKSNKIG